MHYTETAKYVYRFLPVCVCYTISRGHVQGLKYMYAYSLGTYLRRVFQTGQRSWVLACPPIRLPLPSHRVRPPSHPPPFHSQLKSRINLLLLSSLPPRISVAPLSLPLLRFLLFSLACHIINILPSFPPPIPRKHLVPSSSAPAADFFPRSLSLAAYGNGYIATPLPYP